MMPLTVRMKREYRKEGKKPPTLNNSEFYNIKYTYILTKYALCTVTLIKANPGHKQQPIDKLTA